FGTTMGTEIVSTSPSIGPALWTPRKDGGPGGIGSAIASIAVLVPSGPASVAFEGGRDRSSVSTNAPHAPAPRAASDAGNNQDQRRIPSSVSTVPGRRHQDQSCRTPASRSCAFPASFGMSAPPQAARANRGGALSAKEFRVLSGFGV